MRLGRDEIALLEELNFNAWPALRTVHYDGWLLRCTGGESRRVNSVNSFARGVVSLDEKIAAVEEIYTRWGQSVVFRLTPLAEPELDAELAARGFVADGATFVQTAEIDERAVAADVRVSARPDGPWIEAARLIRGLNGEAAALFAAQHQAIGIDTLWALVISADAPLAVGAVAIERGWAGLHGIYVAKTARRRGLARRVSEALLGCAYAKGARQAWLQVEQANSAALPLYTGLGFETAYTYHYRVRPG